MVVFNKIKHKLNKMAKLKPTNKWKVLNTRSLVV